MVVKQPVFQSSGNGPQSRSAEVRGRFVDRAGESWYLIENVDEMAPFFVSVVSSDDHWMFVSSTGGLTAGRVSPETSLFPYTTVDRIHDSAPHTGSMTLLRIHGAHTDVDWDPFAATQIGRYSRSRHIYKSALGDKLCFEEVNHDLKLAYRYTWTTSDRYGFVRECELENFGEQTVDIEILDGLQNLLPAGTPRFAQTNSSNLVDAYKWAEFDPESGLALFTLYSGITDRAEPCESLHANVAYCLGLDNPKTLISTTQINDFRKGSSVATETLKRGVRGTFLVNASANVEPQSIERWQVVINSEHTQADVVELQGELCDRNELHGRIRESVRRGSDRLAKIMAASDAFQATAEENVTTHHYANVLFNVLRGGAFHQQYQIARRDLLQTIRSFNTVVYAENQSVLESLPEEVSLSELIDTIDQRGDRQLQRLCGEYLPITFGRRHGDPSRPWNQFSIRLRDGEGQPRLFYEGNWRDIFQNWEALLFSFPEFAESVIAKFVNASTVDGYNPYRITKDGIDWEVEEPDDPWSFIGYWGDHQIIYLQKLLELSRQFHPQRLTELLRKPVFCYANVPYRIRPFAKLLDDPKATVDFDENLASRISERVSSLGADGKLVLDGEGKVYQVNLLEKLLIPLLGKLGNFVVDGGIWMNTQRPEWNDANNALVGHGLSMVTLYYLRRYVQFLDELLAKDGGEVEISQEVASWLEETSIVLRRMQTQLGNGPINPAQRYRCLAELGEAAERYRETVYRREGFSGRSTIAIASIHRLLADAKAAIDHSIETNRRTDGMYHAYNLLIADSDAGELRFERLYPMLEGQVSALSAGAVSTAQAIEVLEALFESDIYRPDQRSFMLYPDRDLPSFLEKNRIPESEVFEIPLLRRQLADGDNRLVHNDVGATYRFNAELVNSRKLQSVLDDMVGTYGMDVEDARGPISALYEKVFDHRAFTGRSGTMFGFEGLGCIYWHMVAKLLLAVQENYFQALESGADSATLQSLGTLYYRVRCGIGFNKTPAEFGAFPADPYSHTPRHSGARQPGMTGQVKEEILTRFGELGVRVRNGIVHFDPRLLRAQEFDAAARSFRYLSLLGSWVDLDLQESSVAFTWCQIPIIYTAHERSDPGLIVTLADGSKIERSTLDLPAELSATIFDRSGDVQRVDITVPADILFTETDHP